MTIRYKESTMVAAEGAFRKLSADIDNFLEACRVIAAIPLPEAGSAAEKALSSRPTVVAGTEDVLRSTRSELATLADNVRDTLAAYRRGEAENIDAVNTVWNDLGQSDSRGGTHRHPEFSASIPQLALPSSAMHGASSQVEPSLLPYKLLKCATLLTDLPNDAVAYTKLYLNFLMFNQPGAKQSDEWSRVAMGQYAPISAVGDGYAQMGLALQQMSDQIDLIGSAMISEWNGDSAEVAGNYVSTLRSWTYFQVGQPIKQVGDEYQDVAKALYIQAARAAGEVDGYMDVLTSLVLDISLDQMRGLKPKAIVFKNIFNISKTRIKLLKVINILLQLTAMALDLLDRLRLNTVVTGVGQVDRPRRR